MRHETAPKAPNGNLVSKQNFDAYFSEFAIANVTPVVASFKKLEPGDIVAMPWGDKLAVLREVSWFDCFCACKLAGVKPTPGRPHYYEVSIA